MIPVKVKLMKLVFMVGEGFGWFVDSTAILPCLWCDAYRTLGQYRRLSRHFKSRGTPNALGAVRAIHNRNDVILGRVAIEC